MNKYKKVILVLRLLSSLIFIGTLFVIVVPFILFWNKPESTETFSFLLEDNPYSWFMEHEKINEGEPFGERILFADEQILEQSVMEQISQNSIVMERVFHEVREDNYKIQKLSSITGINYSGYEGKSYTDLSSRTEIPEIIVKQYESINGQKWDFYGEGIVITNGEHVIVLQKGKDYKGNMKLVAGSDSISYKGNFEITSGSINTTAIADFRINLNAEGKGQLDKYGLSAIFPAGYEMNSPLYDLVYFTGDFSAYQPELPEQYEWLPTMMQHKLLYTSQNNEQAYWQWYYPELVKMINRDGDGNTLASVNVDQTGNKVPKGGLDVDSDNQFLVDNKKIYRMDETNNKSEFFIKGVNLGAALPGKEFTEFPQSKEIYLEWFTKMKELNVNTVRIYTLFPPVFYEALYEFNMENEEPLYLLQEIWPEENPVESNYLDATYNLEYHEEIKRVANAIHGNANIPERDYRAYGLYRFDVSKYLVSYLVGREMEPEEVLETDRINEGYQFQGEYLFSETEATPTESWLAESCDYVLQIEAGYQNKPIVGIVSWPTLDPMEHDSEWNEQGDKSLQYNDKASVNIDHIGINKENVTGFVGAYHIYPNYPDFMNNDSQYADYKDEEGTFRYGGYLQDFMKHNTRYPAIVAEYGISTSMYTAHYNPDGYHHGGLNDDEQADGIIRMTKSIVKEGYAGAVIFEWMDEWAKKTWITEPYMIPFERNPFWHNVMDPEQNYGLVTYKTSSDLESCLEVAYSKSEEENGESTNAVSTTDVIESIQVGQDEAFVYVDIAFSKESSWNEAFTLRISTASEQSGSDYAEFLVNYDGTPEILVNPGYNWTKGHYMATYSSVDDYEQLIQVTNTENTDKDGGKIPEQSQNLSKLNIGSFEIAQNQIQVLDGRMTFRFPYGLLGITDPSSLQIFSDETVIIPEERNKIVVKKNDVIQYQMNYQGHIYNFSQTLIPWEELDVESFKKDSFAKIGEFFFEME